MGKDPGRFDLEDVGWKKPHEEDPLSKILLRSSSYVQNGAIIGFFIALVLGIGAVVLAIRVHRGYFCVGVLGLFVGLVGGAVVGKLIELPRAMRRQALRAKREEKEARQKKRPRREAQDDDYRG